MLSRLRGFVTRHRRKFIVTGILIGGTMLILRYAQRKLIEIQERQAREFMEKTRRMQHFDSTERTCNQIIVGMSAELCAAIIRQCSTDALLEKLRQNPDNKVELWEEMKIVSFTRLTTYIYATSMLVITLRIQLNLLGGYLYKDITGEEQQISDELKHNYLALVRHFIQKDGLDMLVQLIRTKVIGLFQALPLNKRLSLADLEQLFYALQMAINSDANDPNSKLAKYVMPPTLANYNDCNMALLEKIYNDTLDLLESDDASILCSQNICRGFSLALDAIAEGLNEIQKLHLRGGGECADETKVVTATTATAANDAAGQQHNNNNTILNLNYTEYALAKIIPIVSGATSKGFDSAAQPQNLATSLVTFHLISDKTKLFGLNVYETFST